MSATAKEIIALGPQAVQMAIVKIDKLVDRAMMRNLDLMALPLLTLRAELLQ